MGTYDYAVYFWSLVVAGAVTVPLVVAVAREAVKTIAHLHDNPDSLPSHPSLVSIPSNPRV